ncbi:hypothetical protein LCGC14_2859650 [marine sediment metagenome]|uniref:Uncharacterized protein n=1 Tax=marine sediment metagenome TaxID=412755 RepID=A0A0F8YSR7_9ZZZZ
MGGGKDSLPTVFSDRACWRQPAGDSESSYAGKRDMLISHKVFFTSNPELDERHVLVFSDGRYDVVSTPSPDSSVGLGVVWKVMLSYNTGEGVNI